MSELVLLLVVVFSLQSVEVVESAEVGLVTAATCLMKSFEGLQVELHHHHPLYECSSSIN